MNPSGSVARVTSGTREKLLGAAWSIVSAEGPGAATSRRITEAAGANLAAITYHFGSKDALVGQAVVDQLMSWTAPLTDALKDATSDIHGHDARVAAAVSTMLARFATSPEEIQAIVTLLLTNPDIPGVKDATAAWLTELRAVATDVMVRQQAAGQIPESVNPRTLAAVFTAFALGLVAQATLDPQAPATASVVGEFLGLLTRPETP
jgi:AcrR family transcriptional regulator